MNKSGTIATIASMALFTTAVFMGGWFIGAYVWSPERTASALPRISAPAASRSALFDEAWGRVNEYFVGEVPTNTVRDYGAIRGAMGTLNDKYSYFIEPQTRTVEKDHMRGQFGGIGVTFEVSSTGLVVLTPRPNGAADKAGVKAGDLLISIDGIALPNPAKAEDVTKLRGDVGTVVKVAVKRGAGTDTPIEFNITRELIQVPSVEWRAVARDGQTYGLIQIRQFTERTGEETKRAVAELKSANVAGYVLDLRDNGGGLLSSAVDVVSEFVDNGVVLIERRRGKDEITYSVRDDKAETVPVVVLINGNSASASEVVAGALRDHKRAALIGEKSFGKGSVQLIFDLNDGSSVHVTTAKWITPNRNEIDGKGLKPDIEIQRAEGETARGEDSQLTRAVQELRVLSGKSQG